MCGLRPAYILRLPSATKLNSRTAKECSATFLWFLPPRFGKIDWCCFLSNLCLLRLLEAEYNLCNPIALWDTISQKIWMLSDMRLIESGQDFLKVSVCLFLDYYHHHAAHSRCVENYWSPWNSRPFLSFFFEIFFLSFFLSWVVKTQHPTNWESKKLSQCPLLLPVYL